MLFGAPQPTFRSAIPRNRVLYERVTTLAHAVRARAQSSMVTLQPTPLCLELRQDAWIANVDLDAFRNDIRALGKRLEQNQGIDDVNHIKVGAEQGFCAQRLELLLHTRRARLSPCSRGRWPCALRGGEIQGIRRVYER